MISRAISCTMLCQAYQIHGDFIHRAPDYLHPMYSLLPFEMWGMSVIGTINTPTSKGYQFILAITDYFSKWAEAIPLKEEKISDMIKFVKHHIIYRFSVPQQIIHDNRPQFVSQSFQRFCNKFRIQCVSSTTYYLATYDFAEAFNKTICKLLKKFISKS